MISIFLLNPLGIPLVVSKNTKQSYDYIEKLKPGDIVLIDFNVAASGWSELSGSVYSVVPHIFSKPGIKIICMTDQDQGPIYWEKTFKDIGATQMAGRSGFPWYEFKGKQYLVDYINIGFFPGADKAIASLGQDFRGTVGSLDYYKNDITGWLDSNGIKSAADIDFVMTFCVGGSSGSFVMYWYLPYKTPIIDAMIGVSAPGALVNLNAGMMKGVIISIRGAAEYQYLSGYKGAALVQMDAFSIIQFMLVLFMILGNLGYFFYERKQSKTSTPVIKPEGVS
jgi:hypothetical protein